jgi:hypothetical protein
VSTDVSAAPDSGHKRAMAQRSTDEEHTNVLETIADAAAHQQRAYAHGEDRPLGGYVVIVTVYAASTAAGVALVRARHRRLPRHISVRDVAFIALGTFQLARVITKKPITSALRAPFTRYEGTSGPAELRESVRGSGVRHAIGELVTCPFCTAHWIATAFGFGMVLAPDATRLVAAMLAAEAGADFLQFGYARVRRAVE